MHPCAPLLPGVWKYNVAGIGHIFPDHAAFPRSTGTLRAGILSNTTLALEYGCDKFKNDDQIDRVIAQLALEF